MKRTKRKIGNCVELTTTEREPLRVSVRPSMAKFLDGNFQKSFSGNVSPVQKGRRLGEKVTWQIYNEQNEMK